MLSWAGSFCAQRKEVIYLTSYGLEAPPGLCQSSDLHMPTVSLSHSDGLSPSPAPVEPPHPFPKLPDQQEATTGTEEQESELPAPGNRHRIANR